VCHFNDELAFLVFLTRLKGMFVFPAESCFAAFTVDVCDSMKSSQEDAFFSLTASDVYNGIEEICASLTSLKGL
jgi:hypothetical protein